MLGLAQGRLSSRSLREPSAEAEGLPKSAGLRDGAVSVTSSRLQDGVGDAGGLDCGLHVVGAKDVRALQNERDLGR